MVTVTLALVLLTVPNAVLVALGPVNEKAAEVAAWATRSLLAATLKANAESS